MSPLVLKMTTAASCIYPKKPYQILFNSIFSSTSTSTSTPSSFSPSSPPFGKNFIEALTHTRKYSGCRITPCAPLPPPILPLPLNLAPRFPKCFSASSSSRSRSNASGGSFEDRGESSGGSGSESGPGGVGGLMADMGSENHKGTDWYDSQLYPNQDELLSPLTHQQKQQQQQSESSSKFLTLPTILTLGRVAAVPVLISTFYIDSWWGTTATTSIFIAAAITDWLDGYIARKMKLGSAFGAFLDPVADKLMVAATLVLLCSRPLDVAMFGQVPWLFVVPSIAIIGREITMSAVREWAASQNTKLLEAVAVNNLGKWKTATQMIALTILLATRDNSFGRADVIVASGVFLLYVSAGLAVWSLIMYMSKIWKVLLR